jgi:hypothetical protein
LRTTLFREKVMAGTAKDALSRLYVAVVEKTALNGLRELMETHPPTAKLPEGTLAVAVPDGSGKGVARCQEALQYPPRGYATVVFSAESHQVEAVDGLDKGTVLVHAKAEVSPHLIGRGMNSAGKSEVAVLPNEGTLAVKEHIFPDGKGDDNGSGVSFLHKYAPNWF